MSAIKTQCCWAKLPKLSNSLLVSRCLALTLFSFGVSLSLLFWCLAVSRSLPLFKQLLYCFSLVSVWLVYPTTNLWLVYPTTDLMSIPLLTCVSLVLRVSSPPSPPIHIIFICTFQRQPAKIKKAWSVKKQATNHSSRFDGVAVVGLSVDEREQMQLYTVVESKTSDAAAWQVKKEHTKL